MDILQIPMTDVMDRLGMEYYSKGGDEYAVIENGVRTDGRTFQTKTNLMYNNTPSKGYRPNGNNINLVMWRNGLNAKESAERLKETFNYSTKKMEKQQDTKDWDSERDKLKNITAEGLNYLSKRGVDYEKVKDIVKRKRGSIALRVNKRDKFCGIVLRNTEQSENRFSCVKGTDGKAVYSHGIDEKLDYLFIVEGFFDFLTLRQFTTNVIGLRSASDGYTEVERYAKDYNVILIPHQDDAGNKMEETLKKYNVKSFNVNHLQNSTDFNDYYLNNLTGMNAEEVISIIKTDSVEVPYNDGKIKGRAFDYPDGPFEKEFGCIISGELVVVTAGSNHGKTSFVLSMLRKNSSQGKKVGMINMEFDLEEGFKAEFFRARGLEDSEIKAQGTDKAPLSKDVKKKLREYIDKRNSEVDIVTMTQGTSLEEIMAQLDVMKGQGYKLVAIDSFSSIGECSDGNEPQNKAMKAFRNYCTTTGMAVILIHHFNKGGKTYSGSKKIKDLSNVLIEIFPAESIHGNYYRAFSLSKDKPHSEVVWCHTYYSLGNYVDVPEFERDSDYTK